MVARLLPLLTLVAGCESVSVLELVVLPSPGVTSVRMYSSTSAGQYEAIGPEQLGVLVLNQWWALDPHADLDIRDASQGEQVVFQLLPGDDGTKKLSRAVFVGFDSAGSPRAFAQLEQVLIPSDAVSRHEIELTLIDPQTQLVHTWPKGENTCVAYGPRQAPLQTEMIVPADDRDCDALDKDKCLENVYLATITSPLDQVHCLTLQPVTALDGTAGNACVLGGPTCTDVDGLELGCFPTPYCVPASVRKVCQFEFPCAANVLSRSTYANLPTAIVCSTGRTASGGICDLPLDVSLGSLRKDGTKCEDAIQITGGMGFGPSVVVKTPVTGVAPITLAVANLDDNCDFTITPSGSLVGTNEAQYSALVAGKLDNKRGFAIPIVIFAETNLPCGSGSCALVHAADPDFLEECLYSPILPAR